MLARAGKAKRRSWTDAEDLRLRELYGSGKEALRSAFPGRTLSGIYQRAFKLGIQDRPHWSERENKQLFWLWESGLRLSAIAKRIGRDRRAVYAHAKEIGLKVGCPAGFESMWQCSQRTGYWPPTLRRILKFGGVKSHIALADPKRPPRHYRQRFVDPEAVDAAIRKWQSTEPIETAARARGLVGMTLRRWLREANVIADGTGRKHQRVPSEVIDRVVAERRRKSS